MTEQQSLDWKLQRASALKQQGSLAEAAASLREALSRVGLVSRLRHGSEYFTLGIELLVELADVTARQGSCENALTLLGEGLDALAHESGNGLDRLARRIRERKAWVLFRLGKSEEAMTLATTTLAECEGTEDPRACADLHNTLAGIRWQRGEIDPAIHDLELALGLYGSIRDEFGVANACTNLGVLEFTRGAWQQAADYFERSERTRLGLGWITGRAANLVNLGLLHMSMGDHTQARWEMKESLRLSLASGEALDMIHARMALAHLSIVKADFDDAAKHLAAVRGQRKNLSPDDLVQSLWLEALVTAEDRGLDAGVEVATQALQIAVSNGVHDSAADSLRTLGILEARGKHYPQAESLLRDSVAESEAARDPYRAGLALMELGMIYDKTGRRDDAGRMLNQARGVFERLGASRDLERLRSRA